MSRSSDLAPLIAAAAGGQDIGFRQGVIVAWNPATGSNTVNVNGTLVDDLPTLNLGTFAILQPDDVVLLLRLRTSYFILGRVIMPAAPDRNRALIDFDSVGATGSNFAVSTSHADKVTGTINVPSWADEVMVYCHVYGSAKNNAAPAASHILSCTATINGTEGGSASSPVTGTGVWPYIASSALRIFNVAGNPSFPVGGRMWASAAFTADAANVMNLNAIAVFRRID